jgi:hypothetical protein
MVHDAGMAIPAANGLREGPPLVDLRQRAVAARANQLVIHIMQREETARTGDGLPDERAAQGPQPGRLGQSLDMRA